VAVELIAHRGASREHRENTLPAFARAIELGAHGIELDVHCTRDGVVVVHHDAVPRGDSSMAGVAGQPIETLSAEEVASVRLTDGSRIPTLRDVIDLAGDRVVLYVELKGRGIEGAVLDCLAEGAGRYAVHAFDHSAVFRTRELSPDMPTGILLASYLLSPERTLTEARARDYWQSADLVDESLVRRIHRVGGRIIVWTVNDPNRGRALAEIGVDGICSDDIRPFKQLAGVAS
jgi:glycerophosphoryl diester phosphodiesterase